jgi:hypothetical protein
MGSKQHSPTPTDATGGVLYREQNNVSALPLRPREAVVTLSGGLLAVLIIFKKIKNYFFSFSCSGLLWPTARWGD